jgi:hypothetical protein
MARRRLRPMESQTAAHRPLASTRRRALGGTDGNELLTMLTAAVLVVLLVAEGITLLDLQLLLSAHMLIGLVLIPPLLLKIASTGYRFARYYTSSPAYREKGPPLLPLRMMAPFLVVTTIGIFATGVPLMFVGHKSNELLFFHKAFFIAWAFFFGVHFLAYAPRTARSLARGWRERPRVPGSGIRSSLVAVSIGAGVALAIALMPTITAWNAGIGGFDH